MYNDLDLANLVRAEVIETGKRHLVTIARIIQMYQKLELEKIYTRQSNRI